MAKNEKTLLAQKLILEYLLLLHDKSKQGILLNEKEKASIAKATNLIAAIYEYGQDQICEPGLRDVTEECSNGGLTEISVSTIGNTIRALFANGKIVRKDDGFHYALSNEELLALHPVLSIAPQITITSLPVNKVAFFRVQPQYTNLVTEYINSQVYADDIHAVALGDTIMCLDLRLPASSKSVAKRQSLRVRLDEILKRFNLQETRNFDDKLGISEEEWNSSMETLAAEEQQATMETLISNFERERKTAARRGGKISEPIKRNIKNTKKIVSSESVPYLTEEKKQQ